MVASGNNGNKEAAAMRPLSEELTTGHKNKNVHQRGPASSAVQPKKKIKKEKQNSEQTRGWQHTANHNHRCIRRYPMEAKIARGQRVIARRLEEMGSVATGGCGWESAVSE